MDRLVDHPWRLLACAVLLSSCATTTSKVDTLGADRAAGASDCEITFFKDAKPTAPFEVLGKIESHISRNFFLGGKARLEEEGYDELRTKACGIGGNAVVIDDHLQTSASEMTHVHVWATVIRLPARK